MRLLPVFIVISFLVVGLHLCFSNNTDNAKESERRETTDTLSNNESNGIYEACINEKMMSERVYPECPSDIDAELYDLMLAVLDEQDFYVDMEHYGRYMQTLDMLEVDSQDVTSEREQASRYKKDVNAEGNNYTANHISSPTMKSMAKSMIKELQRYFNTPEEKLSESYNMDIAISRVEKMYRSTAAYKSLGSYNDIDKYTERFFSLLNDSNYNKDAIIVTIRNTNKTDDEAKDIVALQEIMDSEEYNEWLPMVWWRWRYMAGTSFGSPSKDGAIANWFYNEYRIKCYTTILRHLGKNPTDAKAKASALLLLEKSDITLYGAFPFGNQLVTEDFFE